jgi:hypothetical protein
MKKLFNKNDSFVIVIRDQQSLSLAIDLLQSAGQEILDVQSPHYIEIKSLNKSKQVLKYGIIAGISGLIGFILICLLIYYIMSKPHLILGNSSVLSIMAYVPVLFTISILFSALGLFLAFTIKNHLLPGQQNQSTVKKVSDDHYILIISKKLNRNELENILSVVKTDNIFEHSFIKQNINLPLPLKTR